MARTAKTKRLSAVAVKRYAEGPATGKELPDGGGLYLRRREGGCYWYLRMTDPATGANQWHRMFSGDPQGGYPHKTLSAARAEAERLWEIRRRGIDPRAEQMRAVERQRQAEEAADRETARRLSVRALFDRWAATELKPHVRADGSRTGRKDGGEYLRQQFDKRVFPEIGELAAGDIRKADLLAILDRAKADGKLRTANVLLAGLKQMFRFALARDIVERNALDTVTKRDAGGAETERERVLSADEITQLAQPESLTPLSVRSAAALWIILATGCRVGELMNARWENIDLEQRRWYLPDTKNGRDHTIHLSAFALEHFTLLAGTRERGNDGKLLPWLLPNSKGTGPVDIKSFGKQLADRQRSADKQLKGRSKATSSLSLPGGRWTAHDLRRTAATLMAQLGVSGDVIDECLNHVIESRVRRTYIRDRRPTEQARAFDALGARLAALVTPNEDPSNVVPLRAA
jgi:integrase